VLYRLLGYLGHQIVWAMADIATTSVSFIVQVLWVRRCWSGCELDFQQV